jgi:hypothetical protein
MPINPKKTEVGSLVKLEEGSYYCMNSKQFVYVSPKNVGVIVHIFWYDDFTYPWKVLGYKFLADIIIGSYKLRDVPDFKINGIRAEDDTSIP